jgi:lipid biosynthesis B12-binding/radical SAM protein
VFKVLLVAANPAVEPYPVYPLGLACVAAAAQAAGRLVRQFDYLTVGSEAAAQALAAELRSFQPDVVGVGLRNIDGADSLNQDNYLDTAAALVAVVRAATGAPIILGGAAFSLAPEAILDRLGADYGVVGEGELSFPWLIAALQAGEAPDRIVRRRPHPRLDEFPPPLFDPPAVRFYLDQTGLANLQTKRGCPHRCAYCSYPALEGSGYRYRNPEAVLADMELLQREYGATEVFFTDSVFNDAGGRWRELAELLARRGAPLRWCAYFRPDSISREDLELLKASGLAAMELGTDAATDATLAGLRKGFSFGDALAFHQACRAAGVAVAHFVIFGGPGETARTVEEGLTNLTLLEGAPVFVFSGVRVLPATPLAATYAASAGWSSRYCSRSHWWASWHRSF